MFRDCRLHFLCVANVSRSAAWASSAPGGSNAAERDDKLTFSVPGGLMLPRGYYMLFALSNTNIPSVAEWVKIQ